ncbi:MAG TPA: hypothetical protein VLN47_09330, partial [Clostridiaceae bacterium]|nr:hypothetical protein [Clostridiaceae bacterium]
TKRSLAFSSDILITVLLMNMLGGASENLAYLKWLSIYGLYDPVEIVEGGSVLGVNLFYIGIIAVLFTASVLIFKRKRLPL